jgi:hypothetical protein
MDMSLKERAHRGYDTLRERRIQVNIVPND